MAPCHCTGMPSCRSPHCHPSCLCGSFPSTPTWSHPVPAGLQQSGSIGWFRVAHVCQHWRQVALDDSLLWATITGFLSSVDCGLVFGDLSSRAECAADRRPRGHTEAKDTPQVLLPHITHTRELRFCSLSALDYRCVRKVFAFKAPGLEHFELA